MASITLQAAQTLAAAAIDKAAADYQRPICVSVCDPAGFLLAFARVDGSPLRCIAISQGKAYTAVRMGVTTEAFLERLHRENIPAGYFCDDRLTALPGGAVLKDSAGAIVGGVGISGLASGEDQAIANALAALAATGSV
ncbi:MAG: heme-binding protein [Azospirillaceae bacterium]|nr:heme-binding protein [Azospirillaceae bacterium]